MPYSLRKVTRRNCYRITNKKTKKIFARCTSKKNALAQLRLLRAMEYNKNFVFQEDKRRVAKKPPRRTQKKRSSKSSKTTK